MIRLIELFGGIGAQAQALENLGIPFEHYRLVEYDKYPVRSYNAIHGTNFEPMDIRNVHGPDLGIVDTYIHTYIHTDLFIPLPRPQCRRQAERNEQRQRHKIRFVMGS